MSSAQALLRLQSIEFEGAGSYRTPTGPLGLANRGRVLISGVEGAGKSMIAEVPTVVLFAKGSPRVEDSCLKENSIANTVTGYLAKVVFESGFGAASRRVAITQAFKHRREGSKYVIAIDGKRDTDMPTGKLQQRAFVKKLAPLSYDEWLGVVYLHQGGVHDLLSGTPASKRRYLTSAFGLDFYDDLIVETNEERKRLDKATDLIPDLERRFAEITAKYQDVRTEFRSLPTRDEVKAAIDKLTARLQKLSTDVGGLTSLRTATIRRAQLEAERDRLWTTHGFDSWEAVETTITTARARTKELEARRAELRSALNHAAQTAKRRRDAEQRHKAAEQTFADAARVHEANEARAPRWNWRIDQLRALHALLTEAVAHGVPALLPGGDPEDRPWRERAKHAASMQTVLDRVRKLHGHCPTCTRSLSKTAHNQLIADLATQVSDAYIEAGHRLWHDVHDQFDELDEEGPTEDRLAFLTVDIQAQEKALRSWDRKVAAEEAFEAANAALKAAPKPPVLTTLTKELEAVEHELTMLDAAIDRAAEAHNVKTRLETLAESTEATPEELDEQLAALEAKRVATNEKYQEALKVKSRLDVLGASLRALKTQRQEIEASIQEHADTALKLKHYEEVLVPYFTSLRAAKVHACVGVLEGVLPVYVGAMVSEQYVGAEVRLSVSEDLNNVNLQLRTGRHDPVLSAEQASGGQRQRFTMAMIGALREVSPRKANVLFWDEPFVALEADGKLRVVNRLLPLLQERCPDLESVFIVSHDAEVLQSANDTFDSVWTVARNESGSSITTGQRLGRVVGR